MASSTAAAARRGFSTAGVPSSVVQHHHDASSMASSITGSAAVGGGTNDTTAVLFDDEAHVHLRVMEREEVFVTLGITVSTTSRSSGGTRAVHVKLTNPREPFFLYSMTLVEDDYGRFKEAHELRVDFNEFPRDLVAMIANAASGSPSVLRGGLSGVPPLSPLQASANGVDASHVSAPYTASVPQELYFVVSDPQHGTLRVMERTEFRALEHLSLTLVKQGDVGQKQHLAERFKFFEAAFRRSERERQDEEARSTRSLQDLQEALDRATAERDTLRQRVAMETKEAETSRLQSVSSMQDAHAREIREVHTQHEAERARLVERHELRIKELTEQLSAREELLRARQVRTAELESSEMMLSAKLQQVTSESVAWKAEVERLTRENVELVHFRKEATQQRTSMELEHVTLQERFKHATETIAAKDGEVRLLRQQNESAARSTDILAQQLHDLQQKLATAEASLAKSHHIIGNQLSALKASKEKIIAAQQLQQLADAQLAEKSQQLDRSKNDAQLAKERQDMLHKAAQELKEQLQRAEEQNSKLVAQLKQSEDALMHLHRMQSSGGAGGLRSTWGAHSLSLPPGTSGLSAAYGGGGLGGGGAPQVPSQFRDFARGVHSSSLPLTLGAAATHPSTAPIGGGGGVGDPSLRYYQSPPPVFPTGGVVPLPGSQPDGRAATTVAVPQSGGAAPSAARVAAPTATGAGYFSATAAALATGGGGDLPRGGGGGTGTASAYFASA